MVLESLNSVSLNDDKTDKGTEEREYKSYLNNEDDIDGVPPTERKHKVSSLSLSDLNQWHSGLQKMTSSTSLSKPSSQNLRKVDSMAKLSRNSSIIRRRRRSVINHKRVASYAFCFDIDGVILRGPSVIPEAIEAMKLLSGENKYNIMVPSIFVTNGGGKPEYVRAQDLSNKLHVNITPEQIIQGHTPMKALVNTYENVLVVGGVGDVCRNVAESYGFKNVYTPIDIIKWNPDVTPYHDLTEDELKCARDHDFSKISIDAILVFADSRNWAADQQIILELLLSKGGVMGTESKTYDEGPEIYFAHSDFIWATKYKLSRYGMGALQVCIAAIFREHTGKELKVKRFGKPQKGTFKFANTVLANWRRGVLDEHLKKMNIQDPQASEADILVTQDGNEIVNQAKLESHECDLDDDDTDDEDNKYSKPVFANDKEKIALQLPPASTVYFVGDTPESDIRFANSHDSSWFSILVKTGVYKEGTIPKYRPKHLCENVLEAVKFAIEREHEKELAEWNEGAEEEEVDKNSRVNFADLVMTPADKEMEEQKKQGSYKDVTNGNSEISQPEEVEIPGNLSEEISKVKNVKV